ncbi:CpsB/CapC family capsule biosynthesis tyrosine phosphatase [Reichenbachiella sp. MALMAid0571]|uniref:tyrosine-protein phosphatase n=1 Tax=Reichenbachiella sp. MALMAid0571 TaxID=3143939 RepID=UPI0032DFC409
MFPFLKKKKSENFLSTDIHSHLLAGIDDGVKTWDASLEILRYLKEAGINKVITTPHIISDYYPNTPEIIHQKLSELKEEVTNSGIDIQVEAAAEYMIDEGFIELLDGEERLLTIGKSFVLVETPFINKPLFLDEVFFKMKSLGYQPILAHPERYLYLQDDYSLIQNIIDSSVLLQINMGSLVGYYSSGAKKLAEYLITHKQVHFLGSDIHNSKHLEAYKKALYSKYFEKCRQLFLYNNTL